MKTYTAKPGEIDRQWFIVDAAGKPLGRMATRIAMLLMGKTKPAYTPHVDTGDFVVVVNAARTVLTGTKMDKKTYYTHSRWVGKLTATSARDMLKTKPADMIKAAVKGMLPKSRLGRDMLRKLKVHAGDCPAHGYAAQKAVRLEV